MLPQIREFTSKHKSVTFALFLSAILILESGCGKNGTSPIATLVNDVSIKTYAQNNDEWIQVSIMLSTGGFSLAGINVPVINPTNPSIEYGQLTLLPTMCTSNPCNNGGQLIVAVNLTQATQEQGAAPMLPNGTPLPVGGLQNSTIIALPVAQTGARIYLAFGQGVALFGAAVPFAALDPAGKYLSGVDVFQPLTFDKINLIAGIFAGAETNTTGVGIFLDLGSVLNQPTPSLSLASSKMIELGQSAPATGGITLPWNSGAHSIVTLSPVKPSLATENKLYSKIYSLSRQGLTLKIH